MNTREQRRDGRGWQAGPGRRPSPRGITADRGWGSCHRSPRHPGAFGLIMAVMSSHAPHAGAPAPPPPDGRRLRDARRAVARITYVSEESQYVVARLDVAAGRTPSHRRHRPESHARRNLRVHGRWSHHPKFGEQFRVTATSRSFRHHHRHPEIPRSGMIKGIGPSSPSDWSRRSERNAPGIETAPPAADDGIGENAAAGSHGGRSSARSAR